MLWNQIELESGDDVMVSWLKFFCEREKDPERPESINW